MRKTEISNLEISTEMVGNLAGNLEIPRLFRNLLRQVADNVTSGNSRECARDYSLWTESLLPAVLLLAVCFVPARAYPATDVTINGPPSSLHEPVVPPN